MNRLPHAAARISALVHARIDTVAEISTGGQSSALNDAEAREAGTSLLSQRENRTHVAEKN
jgi:hypothetical protein